MSSTHFYSSLSGLNLPLTALFHPANFRALPTDWHIIIADVKASTAAVAAGKHNDVNLVAAGSLVAAINVARAAGVEVPFFFGGDGSTVLVPPELLQPTLAALQAHNSNASRVFGLEMHIGSLPVQAAVDAGETISITKLQIDAAYTKPVVIGNGLRFAEQQIKQASTATEEGEQELNLEGLECRWDRIKPAATEAVNGCYLIEAADAEQQLNVFADVMQQIEDTFGDDRHRNPLSIAQLRPLSVLGFSKLRKEMFARFGGWKPGYYAVNFLKTVFGALAFKYNWSVGGLSGKKYLEQLIAHADTLTIDGRINTIVCGTRSQHQQLLNYLAKAEDDGRLVFGHHQSRESVMTCYIEARDARHIHFVDGADGGYTEAAKELKNKKSPAGPSPTIFS